MKKRFFAGLLACLMVVGLLPLSMWLKPVSAKAAEKKYTYTADSSKSIAANTNIGTDNYFTLTQQSAYKTIDKIAGLKLNKNGTKDANSITFEVKSKTATVKVKWGATDKNAKVYIYTEEGKKINEPVASKKNEWYDIDTTVSKGKYYIAGNNVYTYISSIEISEVGEEDSSSSEETKSTHSIEVTDGQVTLDSKSESSASASGIEDGSSVTLTATGTGKFKYWKNSNGRVVSTDNPYTFNVYYSDTYTAVYESEKQVVRYLTAYGQEYATVELDSLTDATIPEVPSRYGYCNARWSIENVKNIKSAIGNNKSIDVTAEYDSVEKTFSVKVTGDVDQKYVKSKNVQVNEVITVEASSDNFAYWYDVDKKKVVSYNKKYSFFVNGAVNIEAVDTDEADATVKDIVGTITLVDEGKDSDNNVVLVYEFTIKEGYTMQFAGIVADTDKGKLDVGTAKYECGRSSSANTFKYTITVNKDILNGLNIQPVLKYTHGNDNTTLSTIKGEVKTY